MIDTHGMGMVSNWTYTKMAGYMYGLMIRDASRSVKQTFVRKTSRGARVAIGTVALGAASMKVGWMAGKAIRDHRGYHYAKVKVSNNSGKVISGKHRGVPVHSGNRKPPQLTTAQRKAIAAHRRRGPRGRFA